MNPYDFWAERGVGTFPIKHGEKMPLFTELPESKWDAFTDVPPDAETRKKWAEKYPDHGVIAGNKLLIMDWENFEDVKVVFSKFDEMLKNNYVVKTGKGYHLYFLCDWLEEYTQIKKGLELICEIRTGKHYVVGAGSLHPSGRKYELVGGMQEPRKITKEEYDLFVNQICALGYTYPPRMRAGAGPVTPQTNVDIEMVLAHASHDPKFKDLIAGTMSADYTSRSEAEMALACKLVYYNASKEQIRKFFDDKNPFMKWSDSPEGYRELTIKKAFDFEKKRHVESKSSRVRMIFPRVVVRDEDGKTTITEQYKYTDSNIVLEKITVRDKKTKRREGDTVVDEVKKVEVVYETEVVSGNIEFISKVEYEALEDEKVSKWDIRFNGEAFVGDIDEIVDYLYFKGCVLCAKEELKRIIAHIRTNTPLKTTKVYPAVGIYYSDITQTYTMAVTPETVHPTTDSQDVFFRQFMFAMEQASKADANEYRTVLQATMDFISAMPSKNTYSALIARGYACIAPLAYVLKASQITIFPYLYLYGSKGSSKTQIATTAATFVFGEKEVLASDAVESAFRLGTEFTACTFPRVVDEAQDVFMKNISIFKSGASSTLATKRGNKDKTLDRYSAFCSFIFTSNIMPIAVEQDKQGAVMDRVLVLECDYGADFKKEQYFGAYGILMKRSCVFGKKLIEKLDNILRDRGVDWLTNEVQRIAQIFTDMDSHITPRRAQCLAEVVLGMKIYIEMLHEGEVKFEYPWIDPFTAGNDKALCDMVYVKIQEAVKDEEFQNLKNFMQYATTHRDETDANQKGIYIKYIGVERENARSLKPDTIQQKCVLISTNAFKLYKKYSGAEDMPYTKLAELVKDLQRIGYTDVEVKNQKDQNDYQTWSVLINLKKYDECINKLETD